MTVESIYVIAIARQAKQTRQARQARQARGMQMNDDSIFHLLNLVEKRKSLSR